MTAPITTVSLLTQDDCHFCEQAKEVLSRVAQDHPLRVDEIPLASPEGKMLAAKSGVLFAPGVLVDGTPFGFGRLSERKLRKLLKARTTVERD